MTERTILLRKAKWHRDRRHWKRARWFESMAFDGAEHEVFIGLAGGPKTVRAAMDTVAPGGTVFILPAHTEGV